MMDQLMLFWFTTGVPGVRYACDIPSQLSNKVTNTDNYSVPHSMMAYSTKTS